jgi:integrase
MGRRTLAKYESTKKASINRELAILKRGYTPASRDDRIARKPPDIPTLAENNARHGFFESWELASVLAKLPDYLRPPVTWAFYTGWRTHSKILSLTWDQVDLQAGTVRLYREMDKNKAGRVIAIPQVLKDILDQQWREHLSRYPECSFVFHKNGKRLLTFYKAWRRACQDVGLSGKLGHDFRRTAVRNLVRAGIPEHVAMQITGHLTREVFERFNII